MKHVDVALNNFEFVVKQANDILDCRINVLLAEMSTLSPINMGNSKAISMDEFSQKVFSILPSTEEELNRCVRIHDKTNHAVQSTSLHFKLLYRFNSWIHNYWKTL